MNEEKKELIIKPDPEIVIEKILKPCMIWHHKAIGILLILVGIWWYLKRLEIISDTFWPGILILLGISALIEARFFWKKL